MTEVKKASKFFTVSNQFYVIYNNINKLQSYIYFRNYIQKV